MTVSTSVKASLESGEQEAPPDSKTLWLEWTAQASGVFWFSTFGSPLTDTVAALYTGTAGSVGDLTLVRR